MGARARAYAAIGVINWPGGLRRRDIGGRAFAREPVQLDRITPVSPRFYGKIAAVTEVAPLLLPMIRVTYTAF